MIPKSSIDIVARASAKRSERLMLAAQGPGGLARAFLAELSDMQAEWVGRAWSADGDGGAWTPDHARHAVRHAAMSLAQGAGIDLARAEALAEFALLVVRVEGVPLAELKDPVREFGR